MAFQPDGFQPDSFQVGAASADGQPPSSRAAFMAGVVAVWSLVTVTPLFATVGLQTQVDNPPPRGPEENHQAIVRIWQPPTWDTQRAQFAPDKTPTVAPTVVPFAREDIAGRWAEQTWDTQYTKKLASTGPEVYPMPHTDAGWKSVSLWPQNDWSTQQTRKVSATGPEVYTMPKTDHGQGVIQIWPQNEWPTQVTKKVAYTGPEVYPAPHTDSGQRVIAIWPQNDWPTQVTTKLTSSGPNAFPVPRTQGEQELIRSWPQPEWDTQTTRKTPIPDVVVAGDAPPVRAIIAPIYARWHDTTIQPLFGAAGYQDGPSVGPADNPPQQYPRIGSIYQHWEPRQLQAVWSNRVIDLSALIPSSRDTLYAVVSTWVEPEYTQPRRTRVTASGPAVVSVPPYSGQSARPIGQWGEPAWGSQSTRKVATSGPEVVIANPPFTRPWMGIVLQAWEPPPEYKQRRVVVIAPSTKWWLFRSHTHTLGAGFLSKVDT
jgi:hypothetical protein